MAPSITGTPLYEGKAKSVYATDDPTLVVQRFKDSATAFNGEKFAELPGKGALNNRIASILFRWLDAQGIASHYVDTLNTRDMLIKRVEIIPLEVVVRNRAAGSLAKRIGWEEGVELPEPIVEFYYKNDALGDPLLCEDHITILGLATPEERGQLRSLGLAVNRALRGLFAEADLDLQDFKIEVGRVDGKLLLADEISPDTSRLWDRRQPGRRMDKDVFRRDLADLVETYTEVLERLEAIEGIPALGALAEAPAAR